MNKRKLRRVAIVALVLVLLCNTLGVQASTKKDDPTVIVKDYGSLYTAIAEAKDNDVIGIQGTITIPAIVDLNMSENKAVILRRMEAGAKLVVSGDYGADNKASFRMISFDGNSTDVGGTEPVDPEPTEPSTPDPVTPPSGGDEGKTDPDPTDPTPTEPTDPTPIDPEPTDPKPTEPDKPNTTEPSTEAPETTSIADKNINIEAKGVDVKLEITGDSYNISISASEGQESQIQPVNEVSTVNTPESTTEPQRSPNWIEYITVILLAVLVGLEIKDKLHKEK